MSIRREYYRVIAISREDIASEIGDYTVGKGKLPQRFAGLSEGFMRAFANRLGGYILGGKTYLEALQLTWRDMKGKL